jgi:hypothetical protein
LTPEPQASLALHTQAESSLTATLLILIAQMETTLQPTRATGRNMARQLSSLSTASFPNLISLVESRYEEHGNLSESHRYAGFRSSFFQVQNSFYPHAIILLLVTRMLSDARESSYSMVRMRVIRPQEHIRAAENSMEFVFRTDVP